MSIVICIMMDIANRCSRIGGSETRFDEVSLEFIEWRDLSTFVRYAVDGDQISNMKAAYEAGENVPPVDLFTEKALEDESGEPSGRLIYYIGDGWHRFHALRELGRAVIVAVVHAGGRREALKYALGANAMHGLRRTNKDKRKAVEVAVREFSTLSNRAIADMCHVGPSLVNDVRPQLPDSGSSRIGKDGKSRRVVDSELAVTVNKPSSQLEFFELLGREWEPVVKSFDLTIQSVAWLDERVAPEKKLEAISAIRRQLDGMRAQLAERERAIKTGLDGRRAELSGVYQKSNGVAPINDKPAPVTSETYDEATERAFA